jgi:hypothetical protein
MDVNFAVVDAGFTTKPAVTAVVARDGVNFLKNSFADPHAARYGCRLREKLGGEYAERLNSCYGRI